MFLPWYRTLIACNRIHFNIATINTGYFGYSVTYIEHNRIWTYYIFCSMVDERPKRYRVNHKRCGESPSADRPIDVSSALRSNSYAEKRPTWSWPRTVAKHVRGGAMRKNKGMLREKDELTVGVSWEVRECELRCRERGPRETERWNRGDESRKLTI